MKYTAAFFDLDGTIYLGNNVIDEVDVEIRRLCSTGCAVYYITNNTSVSSEDYVSKLSMMGLPVSYRAIISPTKVLAAAFNRRNIERFYSVGTEAFTSELKSLSGATTCEASPQIVVIGFDKQLTYNKLETACMLINRGVPYIITHIDRSCPTSQGPIPDCGAIAALVETVTGVAPAEDFGKPSKVYVDFMRQQISAGDYLLVAGDRDYTDVVTGLALGADTLLVRSGEFKGSVMDVRSDVLHAETLADFLRRL